MRLSILFLSLLPFTMGCTSSTPIQSFSASKSSFNTPPELINHSISESNIYRVYQRGATGFVTIESLRELVEARAKAFCESRGCTMQVLGEKISQPPYILGNFPRIELIFACVDRVSQTPQAATEDSKYRRLAELKNLLDNGAVTPQEFEAEKQRILKMR